MWALLGVCYIDPGVACMPGSGQWDQFSWRAVPVGAPVTLVGDQCRGELIETGGECILVVADHICWGSIRSEGG